jgi:hypothetical protein
MKVTPPFKPSSQLYLSGLADGRRPWKVGELVTAIATRQHSARELTLQIGKAQYTAFAKTLIPIGQPMLMRVAQAGKQPVLELVHGRNLSGRSPGASTALPELLSSLMRLSESLTSDRIPLQIQMAALRLLRLLPEPMNLAGANALRQLIDDSGGFLEAKLLQALTGGAHSVFGEDWKALLLRFRHVLLNLSPREPKRTKTQGDRPSSLQRALESFAEVDAAPTRSLLKQVDEALISIELNQLASRGTDDPAKQVWIVELPVKGTQGRPELLRMRIERDSNGTPDDGEAGWSVALQMEVAPLGHLRINLSLRAGRVSVHILADRTETAELLHHNLEQLEHRLAHRGLEVGTLRGSASHVAAPSSPPTSLSLLA